MSASEGVSIPQLLSLFRESFSETDFNELQETLVDREENMKMKIRDLKMDLADARVDRRLLESSHSLAELERSRHEIKLRRSESKCHELNEKLVVLSQEHKVSCDKAKRYASVVCDKLNSISELENTVAESEQLVVDLKHQNLEAAQRLDESRREKMECDRKLEDMGERLMKVESGLGNILNVRVKDLASLTDFVDKNAAVGERVDLLDMIKAWKDSLGNDCTNAGAQDMAVVVGATSNATQSDDTALVMKAASTSCPEKSNPRSRPAGRTEEDLKTKKRRVLAGGADAGSSRACDVCNVVYKSDAALNNHLAGPKHASMIRRRAFKDGE